MARVISVDGKQLQVPDDATDEQIAAIIRASMTGAPPAPPAEPDGFIANTLDVAGETANSALRTIAEGVDFLGPGAINAGLRLAGAPYQLPTFSGGLDMLPGGRGGFMDEGTARDAVRGFGTALGTAPNLASAGPRNLAKNSDAALELLGFGTGTQAPLAGDLVDRTSAMATRGDTGGAPLATRAENAVKDFFGYGAGPTRATGAGERLAQDMIDRPDAMVAKADAIGYPLTPGERLGSRTLLDIEAGIQSRPMLFNPMHRLQDTRQARYNETVNRAVGVPAGERLVAENMGALADDISSEFKRLDSETALVVDDKFSNALAEAEATAKRRVFKDPEQVEKAIDGVIDKIDEGGRLSAVDYQNLSSEFKQKIRASFAAGPQGSPDPQFGETLGEIVRALDDLAEDSMDGPALARLRDARRRWRTFTALESSGAVRQSGDVSAAKLGNYLRRKDRPGYARGKNQSDLYNLTRVTQAFPARPDSGTATRQFFNQLFSTPGRSMLAIASAPLVSAGANAYMAAPELIAGGARMLEQNPAALGILSEMYERPGGVLTAPLRAGYGLLEDD